MALVNPNIAMSFRQPEIQAPNALAQYAQVQQIMNSQQAQELARYQLGAAQRTEQRDIARTNALSQAGTDDDAIANALLKSGDLKGYSDFVKSRRETQKADVDLMSARRKFGDDLKRNLSANPSDENIKAWGQDAVLQKLYTPAEVETTVAQLLALPPADRVRVLAQSGASAGELKPTTSVGPTGIVQTPAFGGTATVVPGTAAAFQMTPAQIEANKIAKGQLAVAQQRLANEGQSVVYERDADGNVVALPSRLKAGDVPRARIAVAPGAGMTPLQAKPSEAVAKEQLSLTQQKATIQGAIDEVKANPGAFGKTRGALGATIGESAAGSIYETDAETQARGFVFNVISNTIKERAGTAQSAGERDTLNRFLPSEFDDATQIENKLEGFKKFLDAKSKATFTKPPKPPATPGIDLNNPLLK